MINFLLSGVSLVWERRISGISAPEVLVALTPFLLLLGCNRDREGSRRVSMHL